MSDTGSDSESGRSASPSKPPTSKDGAEDALGSASPDAKRYKSKSRSRSRSQSRSPSRSKSNSPSKLREARSKSRSKSQSRSRSGSRTKDAIKSRSRSKSSSRSRSPSKSRSRSQSRSRSRSRSRSKSNSTARSRSRSKSSRSRSGSRSPSRSRSRSKSKSRSVSPALEIDEQGSPKSDKEEEQEGKKKSSLVDSDSEIEEGADKGVSAAAIFGDDADDISDDSDNEKEKAESDKEVRRGRSRSKSRSRSRSRSRSAEEEDKRVGDEEEDKENEPEPIPETRIDVEVPKITCDLGRDLNFVKLPNFLSVETRPFDPETYEDEIDEEETLDEEGRARLKLKVENTIRWRDALDSEGNMKKESNARFVRWSDGSYSLHLGSEIFDVYRQPLQGDHNHLFIRQGTGLQGQAVFRTKLSFRPHSTESFTHRKMTLSLADRSQKTSGIKILSQVGADPDSDRWERLKKEEEKLRQTTARPKAPRKKSDSAARGPLGRDAFREEEGSDDEGTISISAIKNKYKSGANAPKAPIYSSDEEGSDVETRKGRKGDKARAALKDSEEEEESGSE